MKKGLITLTLAILPVFGFASANLASLISPSSVKTHDVCTIQYNANKDRNAFCTCYGNEMHDNDKYNPKRPANVIFAQMCHLTIPVACAMGCAGDKVCETDCKEASYDYGKTEIGKDYPNSGLHCDPSSIC